jgi:hypothetical protein
MWVQGIRVFQRLFGRGLGREASQVLRSYSGAARCKQEALIRELTRPKESATATVSLGTAASGKIVNLPVDMLAAHSIIVGSSGAGKSFEALSLVNQLLTDPSLRHSVSFGVLDCKGELFREILSYLHAHLYRLKPDEREALAKRIVIIDFSNSEHIAPYNILSHREDSADELLVADRLDTMSEQFSGLSEMSVRMKMIATYLLLLMAEFDLPLPFFERLCTDSLMLNALAEKSENPRVRDYFRNRFGDENDSTILALRQRIDSLLLSESVRLSLSASSAPDFAALQDGGAIVLINTAGRNITRGTSRLLQSLVLSDIKQGVFRRSNPRRKFLWFIDEAQEIYKTSTNREHMVDLLTMARSFGSFFVLLTQSISSAVRDADVLNSLLANVRWIMVLRSTLRDASIIAPAIPITRMLAKPKRHPYEPVKYMTESEELKARLSEITKLPDREAYLWLKGQLAPAVRLTTPFVPPPYDVAGCSREGLDAFVKATRIGQGVPRVVLLRQTEWQERRLRARISTRVPNRAIPTEDAKPTSRHTLVRALEEVYAKKRGLPKEEA